MGAKKNACRILVGKPAGKILLRIPTHGWKNIIKMDLRENVVLYIYIYIELIWLEDSRQRSG
jgi:hypothetical protein